MAIIYGNVFDLQQNNGMLGVLISIASAILMSIHNIQFHYKTSKFHGEFMSPALFLFEVLKIGKLTRGPLVLYHQPKY